MKSPFPSPLSRQRGFALVLVLAFVVLLVGVCLAFFSNSLLQRQVSSSSATRVKVDMLAQGAVDTTIADLKQEMALGSADPAPTPFPDGSILYNITDSLRMVPERVGTADDLPNVLKTSVDRPFSSMAGASNRASAVKTTTASANGRTVDLARWNKPLLMTPTGADNAPPGSFVAPNWIYVSSKPGDPNPKEPNASVNGRYAYVIYDEGGLLDINVAGYPGLSGSLATEAGKTDIRRKMGLPSIDLRELKDAAGNALLANDEIDKLINWRNFVTAPKIASAGSSAEKSAAFAQYVRSTGSFLKPGSLDLPGGRSDAMFVGRRQLIDFVQTQLDSPASLKSLEFLTTFTRGLDQPSIIQNTGPKNLPRALGGNILSGNVEDDVVNPSFLSIRVTGTLPGGRSDGSDLIAGEPLVKKRFALDRLAWLTMDGPSAAAPAATKQRLKDAGIPDSLIAQGTVENIRKFFGLNWGSLPSVSMDNKGENGWVYDVHNGAGAIKTLDRVSDEGREPDFFELLKATIHVGSLGKAAAIAENIGKNDVYPESQVPINYYARENSSVDNQVMQIGVNIVDQFDPDSYPSRLVYTNAQARRFNGIEDLPYLVSIYNGIIRTILPPSGGPAGSPHNPQPNNNPPGGRAAYLQFPSLWNPHDPNSTNPEYANPNDLKKPGNPRPSRFRVIAESTDMAGVSHNVLVAGASTPGGVPAYDPSAGGRFLSDTNTALEFEDGKGAFFREPTVLFKPGGQIKLNRTGSGGAATFTAVPQDVPACASLIGYAGAFTGLLIGEYNLGWKPSPGGQTYWAKQVQVGVDGNNIANCYLQYKVQYEDVGGQWITYDLKYGRAINGFMASRWDNVGNESGGSTVFFVGNGGFDTSWASVVDPRTSRFGLFVNTSARFDVVSPPFVSQKGPNGRSTDWININEGIAFSLRPGVASGYWVTTGKSYTPGVPDNPDMTASSIDPRKDSPYPAQNAGWSIVTRSDKNGGRYKVIPLGMYSQNRTDASLDKTFAPAPLSASGKPYYADPDGIVRRAAGGFVKPQGNVNPADTLVGLPEAAVGGGTGPLNQGQSRPLILNRPFRSVAELGYVFRDVPWKNLDFSSPESGDAALLDVFCIADSQAKDGLVAGKIDLNTRQASTLAVAVNSAAIDDRRITDNTVGAVSADLGKAIADAWVAWTKAPADPTAGTGPFKNLSEIIGKWKGSKLPLGDSTDGALTGDSYGSSDSYAGFMGETSSSGVKTLTQVLKESGSNASTSLVNIQRFREAPIRALSSVGQTRVWNVMVDMIAQSGRYPQNAGTGTTADPFVVEGEQRLWVHLAIDRLTGKVLDKQIEVINE